MKRNIFVLIFIFLILQVSQLFSADYHVIVKTERTYMDFTREYQTEYWFCQDKICIKHGRQTTIIREDLGLYWNIFGKTYYENKIEYFLVSNHDKDGLLIPDLKQIDFFLIIQGCENFRISHNYHQGTADLIQNIRSVPNILAAYEIPKKNLRGIDVLISDMELHMLEMEKQNKTLPK